MAKKKACKSCKMIVTSDGKCPNCGSESFTQSFQGRVFVTNPEKSVIAEKIGAKAKGEYAIKIR